MTIGDEFSELRELIEALLETRITDAEIERLEEILRSAPRFERFYLTYMTMQADLVREFSGRASSFPGLFATVGQAPRRPARSRRGRWLPWVGVGMTAACVAAACVATALSIGTWGRARRDRPQSPERPPMLVEAPRAGGEVGGEGIDEGGAPVAVVVDLIDAAWAGTGAAAPIEGRVLPAGRLQLLSGTATLAFVNGVMLTLEGPTDIDLISVDRVFSRRGRLRARVPKGAEGFVITSPTSAVVDLGTEFAMNVETDGRSRVMVFEGAAEAALLTDSGAPKRLQLVEKDKAFVLDPETGRINESPARADGFASAHALAGTDLDLASEYPSEVLRSAPVGYWRFESLVDGQVPNEVEGGEPLRAHGPITLSKGRSGNGWAVFGAGAPGQCFDTEELWELPGDPGHAVEFWAQLDSFSLASLVGFYAPGSSYMHSFLVEFRPWERTAMHKSASVKFLHRWPFDMKSTDAVFSESLYIPRRWHHVVVQKARDRLDLFFDGVRERAIRIEPGHPTVACHMVVGRRTPEVENPKDSRSLVGRIDELAVYDHPLTDEEVRRHFRLGRVVPRPD